MCYWSISILNLIKTPVFTKLHLVLDCCVFKPARLCGICSDGEWSHFLWRFSIESEDYSTELQFLETNYFSWFMWSLMHFNSIKAQLEILNFDQWLWYMCRWHARQNEGVTGTLEDHDLQTSTGESCICNQAQHKKGPFQWLEIYKRGSAQQWLKKGSLIWQL